MDISNTQQLNISSNTTNQANSAAKTQKSGDTKFAEEFASVKKQNETRSQKKANSTSEKKTQAEKVSKEDKTKKTTNKDIKKAINGLEGAVNELNDKINQKDDADIEAVKFESEVADINTEEDNSLISNNLNMQEPSDNLNMQMGANMNFRNNGQAFSEFMNQDNQNNRGDEVKATPELKEEKAILSSAEENIAIAKRNMLLKNQELNKQNSTQLVQNDEGIKKVDSKTNLTIETVVSYDNVVMDKSDVDFFVNFVNNGSVNLDEVQNSEKSSQVSKTLADLLVKSMNENKPVRVDFDNDISVIIKIDRAGKISADFLPSSQVAEAYLKENLPLLRQRFDDNNIDYNELNQRKQKQDTQDNKRKGRKNE